MTHRSYDINSHKKGFPDTGKKALPPLTVPIEPVATTPSISEDELNDLLFGDEVNKLHICEVPDDAEFGHAIYRDGVYKIQTNTIGRFVTLRNKHIGNNEYHYLPSDGEQSFKMLLPKIPKRFLSGMVELFTNIAKTNNNEVMVQIFWNKTTEEYQMCVPYQEVAGASITFDRNSGDIIDPNLLWVMDVHSHVYMNNFFSGTDSKDEVSTRVFGVIGHLNKPGLHMSVRAGSGGVFIDLQVEDIFDMDDTEHYTVPEEEYVNIVARSTPGFKSKFTPVYPTVTTPAKYPSSNIHRGGTGRSTHYNQGGYGGYGGYDYDYDEYTVGSAYGGKKYYAEYPSTFTTVSSIKDLGLIGELFTDEQIANSVPSDISLLISRLSETSLFGEEGSSSELMFEFAGNLLNGIEIHEATRSRLAGNTEPTFDYVAETITEVVTYANLEYEEKIEALEAIVKSATELLADIKENPHLHTKPSVIIVDKMNSLDNDFDDTIADQIAVQDDLDSLFEETPPKKK